MNILYADYQMLCKEDIVDALRKLGHDVQITELPLKHENDAAILTQELDTLVKENSFDLVFTSNFHPELARVCDENHVKYVSWTYDSPQVLLYDAAILSPYSYAFVFDSAECERLKRRGVRQVWYMPLGVNPERLSKIDISEEDRRIFSSDVSIVASLYNEKHNLYDRMEERLDDYTKGFLSAVIQAQKNVIGSNVTDAVLDQHPEVLKAMREAMLYPLAQDSLADFAYIYANYFLCRKVASLQRTEFLSEIAKRFDLKVYTGGDLSMYPHIKCMGTVDYSTDMNKVFRLSKLNLNITLPSIHTGIPLRALDIMGAGGCLLSNWQQDFDAFFEMGADYVGFTSLDDALYLIEYYLEHEEERQAVVAAGHKKVTEGLNFTMLLQTMLDIVKEGPGKE